MCLSTAYVCKGSDENKIAEYVSNVTAENGTVVLTDILNNMVKVRGSIKSIDLVKNIIRISEDGD